MSLILSFKTDNFVIMAGDKRETFVDGSGYNDNSIKVHKNNNYIYGLAGSGELIDFFEQNEKCNTINEFIKYSNEMFNNLHKTKSLPISRENWIKQKFDLSLIISGILDNKTYVSLHQISWKEDGILFGVTPSTKEYPCFIMPSNGVDFVEDYIKGNHPESIEEAFTIIDFLMKKVSSLNIEVSPEYNIEYLLLNE